MNVQNEEGVESFEGGLVNNYALLVVLLVLLGLGAGGAGRGERQWLHLDRLSARLAAAPDLHLDGRVGRGLLGHLEHGGALQTRRAFAARLLLRRVLVQLFGARAQLERLLAAR